MAEHADAGGDVEAEHPPDQPELRRLDRVVDIDVVLGDQLLLDDRRGVAFRLPARRRYPHDRGADPHEDQIDHAEADKGLGDADMGRRGELRHQPDRERRGDERGAAEAHDGHAGGHAGTVGEPFDQRGDRRDVADAETDAAENSVAEIDDPEIVHIDADGGDEEAEGPAQAGGKHGLARTAFLDPAAEDRRRRAEHENGDREDPAQLGNIPVTRRGLR